MVLWYSAIQKKAFWKHMWPSWDYNLIAACLKIILSVLAINITLIFIIYVIANSKLLKICKTDCQWNTGFVYKRGSSYQRKGAFIRACSKY